MPYKLNKIKLCNQYKNIQEMIRSSVEKPNALLQQFPVTA